MKSIDFGTNEEFIANYLKLKSARKMAEYYNCSKTTILNHAKNIGYNTQFNKEIKITNIPIQQIIQDYELLKSTNKVGEKYGCSGTAVRDYLKKNGYSLTNHQAKLTNISDIDFILKYNELLSSYLMAEFYNCSSTAIINHARKIGYDTSRKSKLTEKDKLNILTEYNNKTSYELAEEYHISRGTVTKLWHDNNLVGKKVQQNKTTEKNIIGLHFGLWTVLYKTNKCNSAGVIYWHCKCQCGIEKDVLGSSLRNGLSLSCGNHSNISKGNEKITQILLLANIPFETEKKFLSCKDINPLPFDFYVNNQYLIEYDGIQHFLESIFNYEYTHLHDLIKNQWCENNHIPLIRIPYTAFNSLSLQDLLLETTTFQIV